MIIPALGTFSLFALLIWSIKVYVDPNRSYVEVNLPLIGEVGGTLLIAAITVIVGLAWMLACELRTNRPFFRGETLGSACRSPKTRASFGSAMKGRKLNPDAPGAPD